MESMRSLNTSLPRSSPTRRQTQPPADLLAAFKSAAQSVTLLYKTAAERDDTSRAAGYQDALDDLLTFLDQENLGLGDGEGWRVRQWATERLLPQTEAEQETEDERRARSSSPLTQQKQYAASEPARAGSTPPTLNSSQPLTQSSQTPSEPLPPQQEVFQFRSSIVMPHDMEMDGNTEKSPTIPTNPSIRLSIPARNARKYSSHNSRAGATNSISTSLGHGAGSKRKQNLPDFFDFGNYRDGGGGGKKSRNA